MQYYYFAPLALDSKAGTGLAIPVNPTVEYTTINIYAGVMFVVNSVDQRLDGVWLVSRPLFEWTYDNGGDIKIYGHNIVIGYSMRPIDQQTQQYIYIYDSSIVKNAL